MSGAAADGAGLWWGWIVPVSKVLPKLWHDWATRAYLGACLEDPRYKDGRTLRFLTAAAGQPDTPEGQERARELLRGVRRGSRRARRLIRAQGLPEMWGLREPQE